MKYIVTARFFEAYTSFVSRAFEYQDTTDQMFLLAGRAELCPQRLLAVLNANLREPSW